jgi:two-component system cell cycle response regulator
MRSERKNHGSLLIGSPAGVLNGTPVSMQICKNIFEGITTAQQSECDMIYVVFSELPEPKAQALEALHQVCPQVPIRLLIRMHEEPLALELYRNCFWAKSVLDYLICPLDPEALERQTSTDQNTYDLTQEQRDKDRRIQELATLVMQDDLTGLKNRRYLKQFLPAIIQKADASQCQVTLLLFDIDDFKHYNDSYGHSVGDNVLRQTADLIRRCCRNQDVVARLGGDEFAVVFWDVPDRQTHDKQSPSDRRKSSQDHPRQALFMAERFRNEMSDTPFDQLGPEGRGSLTISGGLATFPMDAKTAQELFEKADQAMLEAKRSGKNRIYLVGQPAPESAESDA